MVISRAQIIESLAVALIGAAVLTAVSVGPTPGYLSTSIILALVILLVAYRFGPVSTETFVFLAGYFPGVALVWAHVRGATYINWHNHGLQEQVYYWETASALTLSAALATYAVLILFKRPESKQARLFNIDQNISCPAYIVSSLLAAFLFWLTEPAFATILTHDYSYIMENRISGAQFAGLLSLIVWLFALCAFIKVSRKDARNRCERIGQTVFILVTAAAWLWLLLHARRSQGIGMGLVVLLCFREAFGTRRTMALGALLFGLLIFAGEIRIRALPQIAGHLVGGSSPDIASLPGGASNVYMTLMTSIHYFKDSELLYGETFVNYYAHLIPSWFYTVTAKSVPPYYFQDVLSNYSYNGGTYILAAFYGNFGSLGVFFGGAFIGIYGTLAKRFSQSRRVIYKIAGLFLVAICFRGFWYEMITIVKPLLLVVVPGVLVLEGRGSEHTKPR